MVITLIMVPKFVDDVDCVNKEKLFPVADRSIIGQSNTKVIGDTTKDDVNEAFVTQRLVVTNTLMVLQPSLRVLFKQHLKGKHLQGYRKTRNGTN